MREDNLTDHNITSATQIPDKCTGEETYDRIPKLARKFHRNHLQYNNTIKTMVRPNIKPNNVTSVTKNNSAPTTTDNSLSSNNNSGSNPTMPRLVSRARNNNDSESSRDDDSDEKWDRVNYNRR